MERVKILVTDVNTRKAFDLYNIFLKLGYDTELCSNTSKLERYLLSLIYTKKVKKCNFNEIANSRYTYVFFPIEEKTILKFYDFIETSNPTNIKYLLPTKENFNLVRNKKKFFEFCLKNNIPVPREYKIEELLKFKKLPTKLIIKPHIGTGSVGIKFIDKYEELIKYKDLDYSKYIIQERIENSVNVEGGFFLCKDGELISFYSHKRLRTYPPSGGVSVFSKCTYNEEIKNIGEVLLKKLNWNGIAMIEFLYDEKSKTYKVIELNPRAWGSILLAEFCNSGLIENYINLCLGKTPIKTNIKQNSYIRWIFPWDIILYINKKGKIKDFWKLNTERTCYINFTYSNSYRSSLFLIYNTLDLKKLKKLLLKLKKE